MANTESFRAARKARKDFLSQRPELYKWLLGKRGVPLSQWEHCTEAEEVHLAARSACLYASSTVRCDILSGMRGIAVEMLRDFEERMQRTSDEAREQTQERVTLEVIALLERDGIDRVEVLRRVKQHFRQ